ncbi:MAG: helix-turn-helix domain-containing protein [Deltaproteobacteria bacterium]|nr:helix-turn-helix domain-containing protein [Deltaproteobacteria bacterium]
MSDSVENEPLVNAAAIAEMIGVPLGTIHQLVHKRRIPHIRLGRRFVRFSRADVRAWLEARRVAPV